MIGGTRNLGPDLVGALLRAGDAVTVLNRGITEAPLPGAVTRLIADRSDPSAFRAALRGKSFDAVIDTTLYNQADARTVVVLDTGRYVFWSSGQVYLVRSRLAPPFRESGYDGPVMPKPSRDSGNQPDWEYGVGKRAAEDALRSAFAANDFPYVSLRMPMIHSVRDHHQRLVNYVLRLRDGGPILVPDDPDPLPLRHVSGDDVIAATLKALAPTVAPGSAFNISQDDSLTLEQFLGIIADQLGVELRVARLPRARLVEHELLPACSPLSGRWMSVLDNGKAKAALGASFSKPGEYLPRLVEAARGVPAASVGGYGQRQRELTLVK